MSGRVHDFYRIVFVEPWHPYLGAILLLIPLAVLMSFGMYWGVFGGIRLWGDHLFSLLGLGKILGIQSAPDAILMHRVSLLNICLMAGAMSAALISRHFHINRPPPLEYVWAVIGGSLMGFGATLAGGCTVGGFFMPIIILSASGWVMLAGMIIGVIIAMKILLWSLSRIEWGMQAPEVRPARFRRWHPWLGSIIFLAMGVWTLSWFWAEDSVKAVRYYLIPTGFAIGFIIHRSRFCFARVVREPFMTGEGEMTRAMILVLLLGIPLSAYMIGRGMMDPYVAIPSRFWIGSLLGGIIFGAGMVFAGGCASGSLWRASEGHLKLVVALLFFALSGSAASNLLGRTGLIAGNYDIDFMQGEAEFTSLGFQMFMPDLLGGWFWPILISVLLLLLWFLFVRYNEATSRFTV